MITLLEDKDMITTLSRADVFGTRIHADFISKTAELIWWDKHELLIGLKNGVMCLSGTVSDTDELKEFVAVIRPQAIMCLLETAQLLDLRVIQSGRVMKKLAPGVAEPIAGYYPDIYFSEYYELLERCEMAPEYSGFCLETSNALKTGTGVILEHREKERLISALVAASVTDDSGLINAVAVDPEYQRKGFGRRMLQEAEINLPGRELFILREENKNEEFYTSCGYSNCGRWCVAEI